MTMRLVPSSGDVVRKKAAELNFKRLKKSIVLASLVIFLFEYGVVTAFVVGGVLGIIFEMLTTLINVYST